MTIVIIILLILTVVLLSALFYFLNKRVENIDRDVALFKIGTRDTLKLIQDNCNTLRANDDILAKDIETLLYEYKGIEKKVKRKG